ncbi:hypothetical protein DM01DRAFT_1410130 [Hesseltinella vesiculosa]|uniref:Adhesin domain-containing protein n=1 Tax=Hesseltinella vesiculosa TaxID=101127 RepID=A0A1X2G8H3_9FUNG|nr:hypothetical protein DM01DRAFT_1410130 [Hesseltinella vesiculosa]
MDDFMEKELPPPPYSQVMHETAMEAGHLPSDEPSVYSRNAGPVPSYINQPTAPPFREPATQPSVLDSFSHGEYSQPAIDNYTNHDTASTYNTCRTSWSQSSKKISSQSSTCSSSQTKEKKKDRRRLSSCSSSDSNQSDNGIGYEDPRSPWSKTFTQKESNKSIHLSAPHVQGKRMLLTTSNGNIDVNSKVEFRKCIDWVTSNGNVQWRGPHLSTKRLHITTFNGKPVLHGQLDVSKEIKIKASNAAILGDHLYMADNKRTHVEMVTSNATVHLPHLRINRSLLVKTSNAPVEMCISSSEAHRISIKVSTSNSHIVLHMPAAYAGTFSLISSGKHSVNVHDPEGRVELKKEGSHKSGRRGRGNSELMAKTSEGSIDLYFDIKG